MRGLLDRHDLILIEASVVERLRRDGRVELHPSLVHAPLPDAVATIDDTVENPPLGFMVNCAHPTFLCAYEQPPSLYDRLIGYQANACSLDQVDLDGSEQLEVDDVSEWGDEMLTLNREYGVKILGGCCGTGVDHLKYLAHRRS